MFVQLSARLVIAKFTGPLEVSENASYFDLLFERA